MILDYSAELKIPSKDPDTVIKSISLEDISTGRAKLDISRQKDHISVKITSEDIVMLRAIMNTVLRHISVSEKVL